MPNTVSCWPLRAASIGASTSTAYASHTAGVRRGWLRIVVLVVVEVMLLAVLLLGARALIPVFAPPPPPATPTLPSDALRGCSPALPGCR
jgi:xanthine/uracil/vitamin C permease (AzgA family)